MRPDLEDRVEEEVAFPGSVHLRRWRQFLTSRFGLDRTPVVRKVIIAVIGVTVLLLGAALIVLRAPAVIIIPTGLAILASDFAWAGRALRRGRLVVTRVRRHRCS